MGYEQTQTWLLLPPGPLCSPWVAQPHAEEEQEVAALSAAQKHPLLVLAVGTETRPTPWWQLGGD